MNKVPEILIESASFKTYCLTPPWALKMSRHEWVRFYSIIHGEAWVEMPGIKPIKIPTGGMVSFPNGDSHVWKHKPNSSHWTNLDTLPTIEFEDLEKPKLFPKGSTVLLISEVPLTTNPMPYLIPPLIYISPQDQPTYMRIQQILKTISMEQQYGDTFNQKIRRLAEVLALEIHEHGLKDHFLPQSTQRIDKRIRKALYAIDSSPEHEWTLESLASEALMSRSAFASLFRQLVGLTPINYLHKVRIQRSAVALRNTNHPINEIAHDVGYKSEAAFYKAFQKEKNISPGQYRNLSRDK